MNATVRTTVVTSVALATVAVVTQTSMRGRIWNWNFILTKAEMALLVEVQVLLACEELLEEMKQANG
jgi:hypothetical protein